MNARHTKEQEKYRSSMLYVHNFFLILTFVSYKLRLVAVDKGYSSEIDFEVIKVMFTEYISTYIYPLFDGYTTFDLRRFLFHIDFGQGQHQ